ncbi:ankyrin repeat, SAM and basic leucine zipper domain-containing protein 1 [Bombyx mori]|uniref:Ankyrin repeat, SAM and basic leucine zipper domain-containing protein 1 n=1 Tax=Bombyx mori TaxID=7091 RepID=A0A8R1WHR3_BOMMO|nr:ankyrin repeat, SAM and basic leucine zipper domain-containing protein 1 [Bombyx mori]
MAQFRPAGFSDEDSDSDDYGFYEKPVRNYDYSSQISSKKKVEVALQEAIINGNMKDVEDLINNELKNNANIKLDSGWTPLMHACFHAQDKIVQYLLEKDADPNLHSDSVTPIMAACSNSSADNDTIYSIVCNLIDRNCILNIGDRYGQTPLMRAISSGRVAVAQKLLDMQVNIEMRDQHGWTAVFWAVHHNQPEILEMLIEKGARLTEVDKSNRTLLEIANCHDHQVIIEILKKSLNLDDDHKTDENSYLNHQLTSWQDYYPGIEKNERPNYKNEIQNLLYGMSCERLTPLIVTSGIDLRTFLLLDAEEMVKLGIEMPYERHRLKYGLRNFHLRGWKLNAVAGLYARKMDNYCVLDCLTSLGSHLHQIYILEATLQYILREYAKVENQIKHQPPDSPLLKKLKTSTKKMLTNINSIRREIKSMKITLQKIDSNNPRPADLLPKKSTQEIAIQYITKAVSLCSLAFILYQGRTLLGNLLKK